MSTCVTSVLRRDRGVKDISIAAAPGEFVAIIGQSGSVRAPCSRWILRHPQADRRQLYCRRQAGDRPEPQGRLHAAAGLPVRVAHHPRNAVLGARSRRRHGQGARARERAAHPLRARPVPAPPAAQLGGMRHRVALPAPCAPTRTSCCLTSLSCARFTDAAGAGRRDSRSCAARGRPRSWSPTTSAKRSVWRAGDRVVAPTRTGEVGPCDPLRDFGRRAPHPLGGAQRAGVQRPFQPALAGA